MESDDEGTFRAALNLHDGKVHVRNYHEDSLHPSQWDEVKECYSEGAKSMDMVTLSVEGDTVYVQVNT